MIAQDARNALVLRPYLVGEDLNSEPDSEATRWIVDFTGKSLTEAREFAEPYSWVMERVKPHRDSLVNKPRVRDQWWLYEASAQRMRSAIADLDSVVAITLVSKIVMPARVRNGQVFSHRLGVFATDSYRALAVLSATPHWLWAVTYSSTLESRVNYSPSDVYSSYPVPVEVTALEHLGRTLDSDRREIMLRRQLGLTKLYNLVNDPGVHDPDDPDIARMRAIHVELDEAVMAAYGWSDVPLKHGFHTYRQMERWTVCPEARVEILDRLLELNHERAAAEAAGGRAPAASDQTDDEADDDPETGDDDV